MTTLEDLERAARRGNQLAALQLAYQFDTGEGIDQDSNKAIEWYRIAANLGATGAAYILGTKYRDGAGVERDEKLALEWFERAAELGDAAAHMFLAMTFQQGLLGQVPDLDRSRLHSKRADECAALDILSRREKRKSLSGEAEEQ